MAKIMIDLFKNRRKVAEIDATEYTIQDIAYLLKLQDEMGRTWSYRKVMDEIGGNFKQGNPKEGTK